MKNKRPLFILIGLILCFALFAYGLVQIEKSMEKSQNTGEYKTALDYKKEMETVTVDGESYRIKKGVSILLIIGTDEFGEQKSTGYYNGAAQADFLLLAVVDDNEKTYSLVHINRDTMTPVEILGINGKSAGSVTMQIALAHTYGAEPSVNCKNTVDAVSTLFYGIKIDNYLSLTMDGVALANDLVGGVTVEVMDDMTVVDPAFVKGETVTLHGEQALNYTRARSSLEEPTNLARMERQKQYLEALITQIGDVDGDSFITDSYDELSPYIETDCSVNKLSSYFEKFQEYEYKGIVSPDGEAVEGAEFMEFYAQKDSLKDILGSILYEKVN